MDGNGQRENGRQRQEQYRSSQLQWLIPQHMMKDHHGLSMRFLSIINDRDNAYHERDLAIAEKKAALAERDIAVLQRDTAISERNNAIMQRDHAIAAFECQEHTTMNGNNGSYRSRCTSPRGMKHAHHLSRPSRNMPESPSNSRELLIDSAYPVSVCTTEAVKPRKGKHSKNAKAVSDSSPTTKRSRKNKRENGHERGDEDGNENKKIRVSKPEWKDQVLGLNQVTFDFSSMPIPVCSCTGLLQPCYKWGNGGWQSACCTTTISMYPLPVMPNKRHARIGGRKMSGSVFTKLLNKLAADGYDLSTPIDLRDHWSKHGTNRYITIK